MVEAPGEQLSDRTAWARNLAAPVRDFLSTETGGAIVIVAAAAAALLWANSPWPGSYESVWGTRLSVELGSAGVSADLRTWVNEGLMTFFFLVVGLEAKREFDMGELRDRRRLAVPVFAAIGGMTLPVVIFLLFNGGGAGAHGWGAAMSTDTALALGALGLVAPRTPTRLRVFLLTLAVVDDLGALIVIAVVYSAHVSFAALGVAAALFGVLLALRYAPEWRRQASMVAGLALWVAMFKSGIDPVTAGLAFGLATGAYPASRENLERATALTRSFREQPTPELARAAQLSVVSAVSLNERLQYRLHPWTSFAIVPLFALANSGVHVTGGLLEAAAGSPITLGIAIGLVAGKPLGILSASWLASRPMLRGPRPPLTWPALAGGGAVAGIGFTVSLLISSLAFGGERLQEAKIGVIVSAILAPALSWCVFRLVQLQPRSVRVRQMARTSEDLLDLYYAVDSERDHIRGQPDASVTLLEYGDFECPYCGRAEPVIKSLLETVGADVRYVWRHLPLNDVHPHAQLAAEASEAAAAQGRFWEMYDALLSHQGELEPADIGRYAADIGLDVDRMWQEVRARQHAPRIADDVAGADASGVSGTPTFFVNGRRHYGAYDIDTLTAMVRAARLRSAALV